MHLVINGEEKDVPQLSTIAALVEHLNLKADRLAIELNRDIVARAKWGETALNEGDRLEIVHFVGGGRGRWIRGEQRWRLLFPSHPQAT